MSFFGFDQPNSLEEEKRRFLESGANAAHEGDVPVYTWGEESYDGLGDALQEGGDELNDETFGGGPVGKDFDFGHQALPAEGLPQHYEPSRARDISPAKHEQQHQHGAHQSSAPSRPAGTLESLWENKSPFSLLPKTANGGAAAAAAVRTPQSVPYNSAALDRLTPAPKFSPFGPEAGDAIPAAHQQPMTLSLGANHNHGVRTLEEIEAEMREAFAAQRLHSESPSQQQLYAQGQIRSASAQRHHLPPQFPHGATPPPRMHPQRELHAQSPRFQQQQQQQQHQQIHLLQQQQQQMQLLELQELRERQQQQQLLELQEQLRAEEIERQRQQQAQQQHLRQQQALREAQMHQHHRQQSSGTPIGDMPYRRQQAHRAVTPSRLHQPQPHADVPFQQSMQFLPREIQMQQKLLAEMAQAEFLHSLQNSPVRDMGESREVTEMLRAEAMRKIMEAERMEERRRRKLEKIRYMSRYNDLMTQSDKDFITRIQVSQLVTQDPYSDDFYAQVYGAIQRSRHGLNHDAPEALLKFSSGGGVGLGLHQIKGGRRPSAMQRMEQQVERIVNNARMREKEKTSLNNLQGALGKTAGRSYKAAPRQLLQVGGNGASSPSPAHAHISKADVALEREGAAREAAAFGKEALGPTTGQELVKKDPLTLKEALMILERLFDITVELDLHKAKPEESEAADEWEMGRQELIDKLWDGLRVMVPLETSNPHPFISLLAPSKGKKLLPRVMRYLDTSRNLTIVTLMVACFSQLDVVRNAPIVDRLTDTPARKEALIQSNEFVNTQMQYVIPVCAKCSVRIISGLLGLLLDRNDVTAIAQTPAGITMLTIFLSRVETVRHDTSILEDEKPTPEELVQWQLMFDHLFQLLTPHFLYLFPSVRQALANDIPIANVPDSDLIDQPTWQFLAAVGTQSSVEQQQVLVTSLRERVLENVASVSKGWVTDDEQRRMRLANVNIFLNALGLDSSQIAL